MLIGNERTFDEGIVLLGFWNHKVGGATQVFLT